MAPTQPQDGRDGTLLSLAIREVRRSRGLTKTETAAAMGVALRTYERFEAGDARLNLDYLHRFARATESDPHALVLALAIGSPRFARRCADNKFGAIVVIALQKLDARLGDRLQTLEARTLVAAVTSAFDAAAAAVETDPSRAWLDEGGRDLAAARPRPGR